jgi:ATP-dependent protease ClpP protease subunit
MNINNIRLLFILNNFGIMPILTHGNYIHLNGKISYKSVIELTKEIEHVNIRIAKIKQEFHTDTVIPILLFVNSMGGCFDSGLAICNIIQNNFNPIITVITGQSASAATMLSVVGHKRIMYPNAYAMLHEGTSCIEGDGDDLAADMYNTVITEEIVKNLYIKNTILTPAEYEMLCIDDKVWDATTCIRYGLIDKIITDPTKLHNWKWLLNITSKKKANISDIKSVRDKSEIAFSSKKRKLSQIIN